MSRARLVRNAGFRNLWLGQLVSIFGDRLHYMALLALLVERAHDPRNPAPELALVPLVSFLPTILIGPLAGALVDTWETRRVLVVSDFLRGCLVLLLIPAVAWGGLGAAFALVFLLYLANTFFLPARSAILPDLVEEEDLMEANSLTTLAGVIATIAGAFLGGLLVERAGWRWGMAFDAITYFVSVLFLAALRPRPRERRVLAARWSGIYRSLASDVKEGARLTLGSRSISGPILALVLLWMAGGTLHVAGTVLLRHRMAAFVSGTGGLLATLGLGMVAGTLLTAMLAKRWSPRLSMAVGLAGTGGCLILFTRADTVPMLFTAAFLAGIFVALLLVTTESTLQRAIEPEARGRVFALRDFTTRVAVLAVAGLTGLLLTKGGIDPALVVGGAGVMLLLAAVAGSVGWRRDGSAA